MEGSDLIGQSAEANRMVLGMQDVRTLGDIFVAHNWLNYFETVP